MGSEHLYKRYKNFWKSFQKSVYHPRDQLIQTGEARVLVIGMGRVGCGAYDNLGSYFEQKIIGIEHDAQRVKQQCDAGRNVVYGYATDSDFWSKLKTGTTLELIVLAMPNHRSNIYAAQQIVVNDLSCKVVAIAKFASEVEELAALGFHRSIFTTKRVQVWLGMLWMRCKIAFVPSLLSKSIDFSDLNWIDHRSVWFGQGFGV
jgi:threonine dehydrogenase-like Zn-dependent dehydrogenase